MENPNPGYHVATETGSDADQRIQQLTMLSRRLMALAETERAHLAHELHTELGSCLTVITMEISVVAEKLKQSEPELAATLKHAISTIKSAVLLKRRIVEELRPSMLDCLGLSASLTEYVIEFEKLHALKIEKDICEDFDSIAPDQAIALFRIAQEALANVVRHANAGQLWISLQRKDGNASLLIEDNGIGITFPLTAQPDSCGLICMRERMAALGGALLTGSGSRGGGTAIEALLPLPN